MAKTSTPKDQTISIRLRFARTNAGLTQREVSARAGIGVRNYSKYETGIAYPPPDSMIRLCKVLGVTSDYLLGLSDTFSPSDGGKDYISIMGADGSRHMYNIPEKSRDRVAAMLRAGFPELLEEG